MYFISKIEVPFLSKYLKCIRIAKKEKQIIYFIRSYFFCTKNDLFIWFPSKIGEKCVRDFFPPISTFSFFSWTDAHFTFFCSPVFSSITCEKRH